jgi:hypothetical protein
MFVIKATVTAVGKAGSVVTSPRQEALLVCAYGTVQVTLRTSFRAAKADLAWIIPVPRPPARVEEADDAVFASLEKYTAPSFFAVTPGVTFGGCRGDRGSSREIGRIAVAETGKAGIYDYTVLTATGTEVLLKWLREHSYRVPDGAERVFGAYVDRGWCWLAVRLNAQRSDGGTAAPRPIRYTYRDRQCVYPLIISELSADDTNEIVLYILSRRPYRCENWKNGTVPRERLRLDCRSPSGTNYEEIFRSLTERAGQHLFVAECRCALDEFPSQDRDYLAGLAGQVGKRSPDDESSPLRLTRLRAVVPRGGMDRDVVLVPVENCSAGELRIRHAFELPDENSHAAAAAGVGFSVLLLAALWLAIVRAKLRRGVTKV